jgi:hypothetical protein
MERGFRWEELDRVIRSHWAEFAADGQQHEQGNTPTTGARMHAGDVPAGRIEANHANTFP